MTGYVYRGRKPEGLPDLESINAAIMALRAEPAEPTPVLCCGTLAGFWRHRQRREKACPACQTAFRNRRKETAA